MQNGFVPGKVTSLISESQGGDVRALEELCEVVYPELRRLARFQWSRERKGHTLQPTAVANEAFIRLFRGKAIPWNDGREFFLAASREIRRVLVEHARKIKAESLDRQTVYAHSLSLLARLRAPQGDKQAPALSAEAIAIRERLLVQEPPHWGRLKRGLANALRTHGGVLYELGRFAEAAVTFDRSVKIEEELAAKTTRPNLPSTLMHAISQEGLGRSLVALGRMQEGQRFAELALEQYRRMAKENFLSVGVYRALARGLEAVAFGRERARDFAGALKAIREELPLRERAATEDPSSVTARAELERCRLRLKRLEAL